MTQRKEIAIQNNNYLSPISPDQLTHLCIAYRLHITQKKDKMTSLIMNFSMNPALLTQKIQNALPGALVDVSSHDNIHFQATVTYHGFAGKTKVAQHRMVYAPLEKDFQEALHALQLTTHIPSESLWALHKFTYKN